MDSLLHVRFEIVVAFIVIVIVYIIRVIWKKNSGPPKIVGLPIVGYLPFLTRNPHIKLMELGKKYGGVFSVRLGSKDVLVLHSIEAIREAFSKNEFLGRPPQSAFTLFGTKSPFFMDDMHIWQEQGKFVLQSLKNLGMGKTKIEVLIQEEIDYFLKCLKSHNGEPFPMHKYLTPSLSNNICALIFGKRYTYDDPERLELDHSLDAVIKIMGQTAVHIFFPWMRYVPFVLRWFNFEEGVRAYKKTKEIVEKKIQEHKEALDPENIRDLIDGYMIEMEAKQKKDPNTTFTETILTGTVLDTFGAGSESVRTSISWCIYTMAAYPDVQRKVYEEILEVIGTERTPEFLDLKLMPYTHSVMLEVLRWKTLVPLNALRYTTDETSVLGYNIPKGTTVTANFWAIHHDPRLWKEPEKFVPKRFLSPDGKFVQKSPNFILFSIGKRSCPGETMAYIEIFLYFVSIIQKLEIQLPEGVQPTFDTELGVTYRRKPYDVRMIPRN